METIILDYDLFIKTSIQKRINKYKLAYDKIMELGEIAEKVYDEVEALFGEDDPVTGYVYFAMSNIEDEAIISIEKVIQDRRPLEPIIKPNVKLMKVTDV